MSAYASRVATPQIEPWRPTLDEYHRLGELGVFEDVRVELLDGVITPMSPKGAEHEDAKTYLIRLVIESVDRSYDVRVESPLTLGEGWEPEPDIQVVPAGAPKPYHFSSAALLIEVADTSLPRDRRVKRLAYARFGIPEYWIVAIPDRKVEVHRGPRDGDYRDVRAASAGSVDSLIHGLRLDVDALWRAATASAPP
jgi:Uma2 family endonuclease